MPTGLASIIGARNPQQMRQQAQQYGNEWKDAWLQEPASLSGIYNQERTPESLSSLTGELTGQAMDAVFPAGGMLGRIKEFNRGFEVGTWSKAFDYPREMGAHGSVGKRIGSYFQSLYKNQGEMRSIKLDINPLETVDTGIGWNAFTTLRALEKKGLDKLSKKAQVKLNRISDDYMEDKFHTLTPDHEEAITIKHNKRIQRVLEDEGYDSISYPAAEGAEGIANEAKGKWESLILFKDPFKTKVN